MSRYQAVLKIIRSHKSFLVTMHHNPDADALSAALSMALFLKGLGKKAVVVNEDASPEWLEFLPFASTVKKAAQVKKLDYEAAIVLDCGDFKRVGGVKNHIQAGKPLVNIDHHVTNDRFGSLNVVDPKASSTCEMVFDLLKEARFKLNRSLAVLLYAGIMTDTGSFRFENTSAKCHEAAQELMRFRISPPQMYERLYVGIPVKDMKLFTDLIHDSELLEGNRVYCVTIDRRTAQRFSKSFDLKDKLFTFLRSVDGIEVVVILTEVTPKEIRVNLRSQNHFDVSALAARYDGGGHKKAAGCKIYDSLPRAKKIILQAIRKSL